MITTRVRKHTNPNFGFYGKLAVKILCLIAFILLLFSLTSKFKTYFPIKSVRVFGVQHVDSNSMQQAITPLVNKGFFAINVENIKDRLLQSPWVSKAIVQRVWPDQVLITVVERTPIARWNNSSLLSMSGELFSPDVKSYPDNLPVLIGGEGEHLQMLQYYKKITRLELTPEHTWNLAFENGMKLNVGYKDVLTRMSHFVKVYPKIIGNRVADVESVDLRYTNGLAVRWKTVS